MSKIALTEFSKGSGCGCKIAPQFLKEILQTQTKGFSDENLIIGNNTGDDAAVYDLQNGTALISTIDFFTPIVDDAFIFGKIAAANALSDVYAMGGIPILATAILGWPIEKLGVETAQLVLEGARLICAENNIALAGGHSIDSVEPFFGLSVNGIVNKKNIKSNAGARAGDFLYLTKKLGVGILSTALKRKQISDEHYNILISSLTQVNTIGNLLGEREEVTALTDVTGFGLIGHSIEMAEAANCSVKIHFNQLPVIDDIKLYTDKMIVPDNLFRNWNAYKDKSANVMGAAFMVVNDPQTNGGLLIAIKPEAKNEFEAFLTANGLSEFAKPIGCFVSRENNVVFTIATE